MTLLTLNSPMIDYLTMTSFRDELYMAAKEIMAGSDKRMNDARVMQYNGYSVDLQSGVLFVGTGIQKASKHNMVRVSGEAANFLLPLLEPSFFPYLDNLTRIDFQVTIIQPEKWSQWRVFKELREKGHNVGWVASRVPETKQELATVYIGNRAESPRYVRLYQKLTSEGGVLLRLEVEIKRDRAREHGKHLKEYATGNYAKIRDELGFISQYHPLLENAFSEVLEGWKRPIKVTPKDKDTGEWIKNQCIPAIDKYINSHTAVDVAQIISSLKMIVEKSER